MTTDEAIKTLTGNYHWHFNRITDEEKAAVELGIEALKEKLQREKGEEK